MFMFSYFVKLRIGRDVGFALLAKQRFCKSLDLTKRLVELIHIVSQLSYRLGLSLYRVSALIKRYG